jgi:hypothetical protein
MTETVKRRCTSERQSTGSLAGTEADTRPVDDSSLIVGLTKGDS